MLTYSFADLQGESMYAHLYKCIKNDITNGVLHAEEKLPSKRMLAKKFRHQPHHRGKCLRPARSRRLYLFAAQARLLRGAH